MTLDRAALAAVVASTVVLAAVGPGIVAADVRGEPELSVVAPGGSVTPGEETQLRLTILNTGVIHEGSSRDPSAEQRVMTARGTTVTLEAGGAPVSVESGPVGVGSVPDGAAIPATFRLSVDRNAEPGTYDLPVEVEYTYTSAIVTNNSSETHRTRSVEREFEVEVVVEQSPQFEVVNASTTAAVGGGGTVAVRVKNVGHEAARDASLTLRSTNAALTFGGAPTAETYVGTWKPGETRLFQYEARVAPGTERRPIALRASLAYENADGTPGQAQLSTGVTPRARQTFAVESVNASVSPGSSGLLTLSLTNTGDRTLRETTATVRSPNSVLTFGGTPTAEAFVGRWEPGETVEVPFEVALANGAPVRSYAVEVAVAYEDESGNDGRVSLLTGAEPAAEQTFDLREVEGSLRVGSEGSLQATIVNGGPSPAENAVLVLEPSGRNMNVGETEFAVGDLPPGESAAVRYDVEVSSAASEGPRQFQFHLEYEDAAGDSRRSDPLYARTQVAPKQPVFAVKPVDATVEAGSTTTLRVRVTNDGEEPVSDVSAKLFANDPLSSSDDEAFVDSLAPGETATVEFQLSAARGAVAKTYPLSLDFQYDDADGDTLVSDTYKLPVQVRERTGGGILSAAPGGLSAVSIGGLLALALGTGLVVRRRR